MTANALLARQIRRRRSDGWTIAGWVLLALLTFVSIMPMAWMLLTSLKSQFAAMQYPPEWIPSNPTTEEYVRL
ncbi:MAG: hypothetical protein FJX57_05560, partial [Alphaproteobacteria bacterium]|nr:hypothetical protein [Alphaproteobacteria bacterium]